MCLRPQSKEQQCHKSKMSLVVRVTLTLSTSEKKKKGDASNQTRIHH